MPVPEHHWLEFAYWSSQTALFFVVLVGTMFAGYQLKEIKESDARRADQAKATFLFELDKMWESTEFAAARVAFETLRADVEQWAETNHKHRDAVGRLQAMREEFSVRLFQLQKQNLAEYARLMRLCGFFETAGMLIKSRYVREGDILELYGGALIRLGETFGAHLRNRAEELPKGYMENFIRLADAAERANPSAQAR